MGHRSIRTKQIYSIVSLKKVRNNMNDLSENYFLAESILKQELEEFSGSEELNKKFWLIMLNINNLKIGCTFVC